MMNKFKMAERRMFHANDHAFIFLAEDNTVYEIDDRIQGILTKPGINGEFTKEELFSCQSYGGEEQNDLFGELIKGRVIMPSIASSGSKQIDFNDLSIELKTLVFHVTDACNLGCRYCYHGSDKEAGPPKEAMSLKVAEKSVDFLMDHSGKLKEVIIVFFGGEPLLNFDLMATIVSSAREKAGNKGKKVDFALTTNATLLSDKTISFLRKNNIGVTISIDGFEAVHDRYRCFSNGTPSYGSILSGLKKLLANKEEKPVVARVTVAGTAGQISERLDHLLALGFSEAGFAPVTSGDPAFRLDKSEMGHLLDQYRTLTDRFIETAKQDLFYGFTNIVDNLVVLHEGERKDYPCGAGLGMFSVDPQGRLYLCQRLTHESSSLMGDVFRGFDQSALVAFREKNIIEEKKACHECWVRKICAGGCYHEALVRQGSLSRPNLHYCQWIKDWVRLGLETYGRLATECPGYLDKLSQLRGHEPLYSQPI